MRIHDPSFIHLQSVGLMMPGHLIADTMAIMASLDPIMGGVDKWTVVGTVSWNRLTLPGKVVFTVVPVLIVLTIVGGRGDRPARPDDPRHPRPRTCRSSGS